MFNSNEKYFSELLLALDDMALQKEIYVPSSFWREATLKIAEEICRLGVEHFRSYRLPLSYFVPTYGCPGNFFSKEQTNYLIQGLEDSALKINKPKLALENFLNGQASAMADYRVLKASDNEKSPPFLHLFSESSVGSPVERFEFGSRFFSRSSLNYLLGLAFLKKHLGESEVENVLEIGGGFGSLGEVLSSTKIPNLRYIDIDIPPTSFVAQYYLTGVLGEENVATYAQTKELAEIDIEALPMASVLCSWQIERVVGEVDLFVNFISFQEMEPHIVENYLKHVSRLKTKWVLLRNMREGKQIKKGAGSVGVEVPILTDDYIAMLPDYDLVERNVLPFGFTTVDGYHSELLLLKRKST